MEPVTFFTFLAIATSLVVLAVSSSGRTAAAWRTAARALGVSVVKKNTLASPQIVGKIDGTSLNVSVRSSGNTKVTRYVVEYTPIGIGLQITRKRGLAVLTEFLGAQDAKTGDEEFDELVVIKTTNPDQLPAILTSRARTAIMELMASFPAAKVADDRIVLDRRGIERNPNRIVKTSERLLETVKALGVRRAPSSRPAPSTIPADPYETIGTPAETEPMPAAEPVGPPVEPPMDMPDMLTSDYTSPAMPSDVTESSVLDDTLEPGILDMPTASTVAPSKQGSVDPLEVAGELFGGRLLSFEATSVFDQRYAGRDISWNGTVAKRSESDIRVKVGTIETPLYGPMDVEVMVASTAPAQPGENVTVVGTLSGVDTFERTITVDGTIKRA